MRRKIALAVALGMAALWSLAPVQAHVAGTFGDFLLGIREGSEEELRIEMQKTAEEIARLAPQTEELQRQYSARHPEAVERLLFYHSIGLDTYMEFLLGADDLIDLLANQRIVEKQLKGYLDELNGLYLQFKQLESMRDALEGHRKLLEIIGKNLQGREEFLRQHAHLQNRPGLLARAVQYQWAYRTGLLGTLLERDHFHVRERMEDFVTADAEGFRLEEEQFNKQALVTYYFRPDHVYVHYETEEAQVILVGMFVKKDDHTAKLQLEAGFVDGMSVGQNILNELITVEIDYSALNPDSDGFSIEHANGSVLFREIGR